MKKILIGILVKKLNPLRNYEINTDPLISLIVFTEKGIDWKKNTVFGYVYENNKWEKKNSYLPRVIYNRSYKSKKELFYRLEKLVGKGKVFNCITKFDKWEIASALKSSTSTRKYIPETFFYNEFQIINLLKKFNKLVLKPALGCFGRKVYFLEITSENKLLLYNKAYLPQINTSDSEEFIRALNKTIDKKRFIVQQFIDFDVIDGKIYDLRLYVHKNNSGKWEVSGGFSRISFKNSYLTNMASELIPIEEMIAGENGFTEKHFDEMKEISVIIAKKIENAIGHLGEICVDFAISQGRLWIIEINGKTQKPIVKRLKNDGLAKIIYTRPIQYAKYLATKK